MTIISRLRSGNETLYSDREHTLISAIPISPSRADRPRERIRFWIDTREGFASTPGGLIGSTRRRMRPPRRAIGTRAANLLGCLVRRRCTSTCRQTNARTSTSFQVDTDV